jgi:hypothetical protein
LPPWSRASRTCCTEAGKFGSVPWRIRAVGQDAERLARAVAYGAPWDFRAEGGYEGDGLRGYATGTRVILGLTPAGDDRLTTALLTLVGRDTSADFYYGVGAVAAGHQPTIFRGSLSDLAALRLSFVSAQGNPVAGPELWWPQDRSWLVDAGDSAVTAVFGNQTLADLLSADADLETVPIVAIPPTDR